MGRGLVSVRDDFGKRHLQYVWLQFTDQTLPVGAPCRCGHRSQTRLHEKLGRCDRCGATIAYVGVIDPLDLEPGAAPLPGPPSARPGSHLSHYGNLQLIRDDAAQEAGAEVWYGRGLAPNGVPTLLRIVYPLQDGHRVPDPQAPEWDTHTLTRWKMLPLLRAEELGMLEDWPELELLRERLPEE
jgi:hypothetical protein